MPLTKLLQSFWGLLGASILVLIWIFCSYLGAGLSLYAVFVIFSIPIALTAMLGIVWLPIALGVIGALVATAVSICLFFFLVGRVAYVPQVMLVEGKSVFSAFGRSLSLASGNVRRLMAMTLFTTFATYAALMILLVPLGWYGVVAA